ncbi:MAG: hypothetical protein NZQ09_10025 [Chloroflexus sp.]|nr:hypothetical protein [Chloroflexus sp.]
MLQREAWQWVIAHPDRFLELTIKRIGYLWLISPTFQITGENIVEPSYFYLLRYAIQIPLLILALIGSIIAYRHYRAALLICLCWLVAFTEPYAISVAGHTCYRLPVEPILAMLAAVACAAALSRWRST